MARGNEEKKALKIVVKQRLGELHNKSMWSIHIPLSVKIVKSSRIIMG